MGVSAKKESARSQVKARAATVRAVLKYLNGHRSCIKLEDEQGCVRRVTGQVTYTPQKKGILEDESGRFYPFSEFAVFKFS